MSDSSPSRHIQSLSISRIFLDNPIIYLFISYSIPNVYQVDVPNASYTLLRNRVEILDTSYNLCINETDIPNASYNSYAHETDILNIFYNSCTIKIDVPNASYLNLLGMDVSNISYIIKHYTKCKTSFP